jgi:Trehalose utilisation
MFSLAAAGLAFLFCAAPPTQPGPSAALARPKVLYLTQSAGFKHAVLPLSEQILPEIYQFKDWSRDKVHVLLTLDPASVDLTGPRVKRTDKDFALAWTREFGSGRVFYTALGHEPAVWQDEKFQQHLLGGIRWAMGK